MEKMICPKCKNKSMVCTYWENGVNFFNDNFRHRCGECGHVEEKLNVYGGQINFEDLPNCPMCGRPGMTPGKRVAAANDLAGVS